MADTDPLKTNRAYDRKRFSWRQMRDCVEGSDAVKRGQEVYLPMPSGMSAQPTPPPAVHTRTTSNQYAYETLDYQRQYTPWWHPNPAYSAYLQRSKFPDITAATLRGLVGVATKRDPQIKLPPNLTYLEEIATPDGMSLIELFAFCLAEVLTTGRLALVLDVNESNELYIVPYCTETYTDWDQMVIDHERVQNMAMFTYQEVGGESDDLVTYGLEYALVQLDETGALVAVIYKYVDGHIVEGPTPISVQGSTLDRLPLVNVGSIKNDPWPDIIPLLGVSDCALDAYRHSADLAQAHFLTCNPTLVFTGIESDQAPQVVGSSVSIGMSNPSANAFYPATDTSALSHVSEHIDKVLAEAVQYGSQLLGPSKRAAESGEALALRQAASGATLVSVVDHVASAMRDILEMAAELSGGGTVEFEANKEFAETVLTAQDISSLVSAWMSGAISHESLLENFIDAGIVDPDKTPEEEMEIIDTESPSLTAPLPGEPPGAGGNQPPGQEEEPDNGDEPDEEEEEDDEEEGQAA